MNALLNFINQFKTPLLRFFLLIIGLAVVYFSQAQVGNVCETPFEITSLPYSHSGNTADFGNDYGYDDVPPAVENPVSSGSFAANYLAAYDVVYAYTPSEDDYIDAHLLGNGELSALWVFVGCPFEATLGWDLFYNSEEREVNTIPVLAGVTYYFVLSSYPNNPSFTYTLELSESPDFDCPDLLKFYGDPCDDGNTSTVDDVVTEDCNCEGLPIEANINFGLPQSLVCGFRSGVVYFYEPGTQNLIFTKYAFSNDNSSALNAYGVPSGLFDLYIVIDGMLNLKIENQSVVDGLNYIDTPGVIVGDINDDNSVNVQDLSLFTPAFGSVLGDDNYSNLSNLNCDASINVTDISIFIGGFGQQGVLIP